MDTVSSIIDRFGGLHAMARALGHKHPTTIQGWKERGIVPARQQRVVLDAAKAAGIELSADDLITAEAAG